MASFFVQHAKRFGLAATGHHAACRLLDRAVGYTPYRCFARPTDAPMPDPSGPPFECRVIEPDELAAVAEQPEYEISRSLVARVQARGDVCIGAFDGGRLAGYAFSSDQPTEIDADFSIHVPHGWIYNYKAYTLPAWRGRRVHGHLWVARQRLLRARGYRHLAGIVIRTNYPSLRSMSRLGFRGVFDFTIVGKGRERRLSPGSGGEGNRSRISFPVREGGAVIVYRT